MPYAWLSLFFLFLANDLAAYWMHRLAHERRVLWAGTDSAKLKKTLVSSKRGKRIRAAGGNQGMRGYLGPNSQSIGPNSQCFWSPNTVAVGAPKRFPICYSYSVKTRPKYRSI